jgi:hypothetical protein
LHILLGQTWWCYITSFFSNEQYHAITNVLEIANEMSLLWIIHFAMPALHILYVQDFNPMWGRNIPLPFAFGVKLPWIVELYSSFYWLAQATIGSSSVWLDSILYKKAQFIIICLFYFYWNNILFMAAVYRKNSTKREELNLYTLMITQ